MKYLFLLFFSTLCFAENRVAIIDTGLDLNDERFIPYLCRDGHKDFTGLGIKDTHGHGTHVTGTIIQNAKTANYCLVIYKYYNVLDKTNFTTYLQALYNVMIDPRIKVVNYSGGGSKTTNSLEHEFLSQTKAIYFVSAGNEHQNLDIKCGYYPACYNLSNLFMVGSKSGNKISDFSNYGNRVDFWENGENVYSTLPEGMGLMSGTSMSTAIKTGKWIYEHFKN